MSTATRPVVMHVAADGFTLTATSHGDGPPVVLVMGTGAKGHVWDLHQVRALVDAGYRAVTYDARGVGQSEGGRTHPPVTIDQLVADLAALVEHVGSPAHVVGTSLGARVVQELALARPELVSRAVAMAAHARLDPLQRLLTLGEQQLFDQDVAVPPAYLAAVEAVLNLSPATLADEVRARDWLGMLELTAGPISAGERAQLEVSSRLGDRREAYRAITVPLQVIAFADDVMIRPRLSREVADAVPGAEYAEVSDAGHFGYLEQPDDVNRLILDFLAQRPTARATGSGDTRSIAT